MRFGKQVYVLITFLLLSGTKSHAQTFYANTTTGINKIAVSNSGCFAESIPVGCINDYFSIAIFGDTLYFLSASKGLYRTLLSRPEHCERVMDLRPLNSLTADKHGMLYGAMALVLVKIDPHNKTTEELQMPFQSAGDLVFYKDRLFLAATPNIIAEINIEEPSKSSVYFTLEQEGIFGLTSIESGCNKNSVFAIATNGAETQLIELDMENRKSLGIKCTMPGAYHDAASVTETGNVTGLHVASLEKRNICVGSPDPSYINIKVSGSGTALTYRLNNTLSNNTGFFENINEGTYHIHVSSRDSCFTDTTVTITKGFCEVKFPSAFTPNDDGRNDIFRPLGLTAGGNSTLTIYNRWGKKIFETSAFTTGWNGKVNGLLQPPGTYIWTYKYAGTNSQNKFAKGTVVLMR